MHGSPDRWQVRELPSGLKSGQATGCWLHILRTLVKIGSHDGQCLTLFIPALKKATQDENPRVKQHRIRVMKTIISRTAAPIQC